MPAQPAPPKVIYVMGAGRSGSTILGVALGNAPDVFFAGELDKWFARSGVPRRGDARLTSFWSQVLDEVGPAEDLFLARTGWLERSSALLDPRKWRARRRLRARYRQVSQQLYGALARVSGAGAIVDSSHYPLRAQQLQHCEGLDLHLVLLVRDAQSVVASLGRRDVVERRFGPWASNAYLWLTYVLSIYVFLRQPRNRRLLVRHEDFVADPAGVLLQILQDIDSLPSQVDFQSLDTGLPFHGNRLLKSATVALNTATDRQPSRSRLTAMLQLPLAVAFSWLRPSSGRADGRSGPRR